MIKRYSIVLLFITTAYTQTVIGEGLSGQPLLDYVVSNYKTNTTLGYNNARDILYGTIDLQQGKQLSCVYSGYTITLDTSQDPSTNAYQQGINCEHTWPQSMGAGQEPQKSDMHHLFPCKSNVNSSRGNDPFGEIPDENTDIWYRNEYSQGTIPTIYIEEYAEKYNPNDPSDELFEPREDHKGDASRAMFYFYAMYNDAADTTFWNIQKDNLLYWHYYDPVDEWEENRTWAISGYQENNPNPFVLDSTLARRIWFYSPIVSSPFQIVITEVMVNPAAVLDIYGEWFEIFNNDTVPIDLAGWLIADGDNDIHEIQTVSIEFYINPGEYVVLGRNADSAINGGYSANYEYSGFLLSNLDDEIKLIDNYGQIVDEVNYNSSFPFSSGASMYLKNVDYDNDVNTSWAMAEIPYGNGDFGTPGSVWEDTLTVAFPRELPVSFQLGNPYPNPFNGEVTWEINQHYPLSCVISVFNLNGQKVETLWSGVLKTGQHYFKWVPRNQSSGIYFIEVKSDLSVSRIKAVYLK